MTDCCNDFSTTEQTASRTPNPPHRGLDDCGDKTIARGRTSSTFKLFMPVKPVAASPGVYEPSTDGVGAVGLSAVDLVATATNNLLPIYRTGHYSKTEVAAALGIPLTSTTVLWALEIELAKANIYLF